MVRTYSYNHSKENVFNLIINESLKAFKKENIKRENLEGLSLNKSIKNQVGQSVSVVQSVVSYKENEEYVLETKSNKDTYTVSYKLSEKKGKTVLEYEEKFKTESILRNLNHLVMGLVFFRKIRKRMYFIFKQLEVNLDNV